MNNIDKAIDDFKTGKERCLMKKRDGLKWPDISTFVQFSSGCFHLSTQVIVTEDITEERARFLLQDGYLDT